MRQIARKQFNSMLKHMVSYPLICIYGPDGFGKTTAVAAFLHNRKERCCWIHMHKKNRKQLGGIFEKSIDSGSYDIIILDQYRNHILDRHIMKVYERREHSCRIILLASGIPSFFNSELYRWTLLIPTTMLRFQFADIQKLAAVNQICIDEREVREILRVTCGWTIGVHALLEEYGAVRTLNPDLQLYPLFDVYIYRQLNQAQRQSLAVLSVPEHFNIQLIEALCVDTGIMKILTWMMNFHWFVQVDRTTRLFTYSPVFREFLYDKFLMYEKNPSHLYRKIADYYESSGDILNCLRQLYLLKDYKKILQLLELYESKNFADYDTELMRNIYQMVPMELYVDYPYAWLHAIMDNFNNLQDIFYGKQLLEGFLHALHSGSLHEDEKLLQGEVELILAYSRYNNLHEMSRYFKRSKTLLRNQTSRISNPEIISTFGSPHNLFLYHRKPGDIQRIVNILHKDLHYYFEITNNSNGGLMEQSSAEQQLESARFAESIHTAWEAYYIAEHYRQKWICVSSLFTIGRAAYHLRDHTLLQFVHQQLAVLREKVILPPLLSEIDLAQAYLYILSGEYEKVAEWIQEGRKGNLLQGATLYSSIVYGMYLIKIRNYAKLRVVASLLESQAHERKQMFGTIYALLFYCILLEEENHQEQIVEAVHHIIEICQPDGIMTVILEIGKDVFLSCSDSWRWRKLKQLLEEHRDYNSYGLTERELELVNYVLKGYSRREMAEASGLKENTVASYMKRLYRKIKVHSRKELKELFMK